MYTPHTVTIYNVGENPDTLEQTFNVTFLRGVFLDRRQAANIEKSGLRDADAATLFIPFTVEAVDAVTETPKMYLGPKAYRSMEAEGEDVSGFWTLEPGGLSSGADSFFIKGEVLNYNGYGYLRDHYDDVYDITTIDTRDFGSADMQHWQVGAR